MVYQVIDLFAGAEGFGLGFQQAGYCVPFSLEIDQWAADTLRYNHPHMQVIQTDIQTLQSAKAIREMSVSLPDVIIGGPPCQGFSVSGPAQKDPNDPCNALFMSFARWVEVLTPKVFVMENVKGLLGRKNAQGESVIEIIQDTFKNLGYKTSLWLLNAAEYGVPQARERIFIVGSQHIISPPPITHQLNIIPMQRSFEELRLPSAVTLWDAISDLPELNSGEGAEVQNYTYNTSNTYQIHLRSTTSQLFNHQAMHHTPRMVERFKQIQWGESVADVALEFAPRQRSNNHLVSEKVYDQNNRRLYPYRPSHTITASFYANFIHPFQHRNLTAREGARIQSFPDYYRFMGKPTVVSKKLLNREGREAEAFLCQYNQIGNAVPPILAQKIAEHLLKEVFGC